MTAADRPHEFSDTGIPLFGDRTRRTADDANPRFRRLAAKAGVHQHAERVDVRCWSDQAARKLFRRGVAWRPHADGAVIDDGQCIVTRLWRIRVFFRKAKINENALR